MATAAVLDFDKLLAPISGENPAGVDLRAEASPFPDYYKLKDARNSSSTAERKIDQAAGDTNALNEINPPEWRVVRDLAVKSLSEKTKDLEVAAYLVEALVRLHGFAGIRDGFRAISGLIENFWDRLYPVAEDSDVEGRFSHVLWLNGIDRPGTLIVPIAKLALTADTPSGQFTLTQYYQGQETAKISDAKVRQKKIDEGAVTVEAIQRAVAASPQKYYVDLVEDITLSLTEFERFCNLLSEKSGYDPPSSDLRTAINSFLDVVKEIAKDKIPKASALPTPAPADGAGESAAAGSSMAPVAGVAVPAGGIVTRDDALRNLEKVADFFRKTEPQSIIPYALDQVATWGRMSLPDLLAELIPEDVPRKNLFKQVGIKPPDLPGKDAGKK